MERAVTHPARGFAPSPGRLEMFVPPSGRGIRVDTHAFSGYNVPPHYDSLLAKLIVHNKNRRGAIDDTRRALDEFVVDGVATTIPFHRNVLRNARFASARFDTNFVEELLPQR